MGYAPEEASIRRVNEQLLEERAGKPDHVAHAFLREQEALFRGFEAHSNERDFCGLDNFQAIPKVSGESDICCRLVFAPAKSVPGTEQHFKRGLSMSAECSEENLTSADKPPGFWYVQKENLDLNHRSKASSASGHLVPRFSN